MDKRTVLELVDNNPQLSKAVDMMEAQVMSMPIMPQDLEEIIKMLEFVMDNPDKYSEVRAAAVQDGIIPEEQAPQEFDPLFVLSILASLYALQERMNVKQTFARGGLATATRHLQEQGRGGDTMLAHINPREAEVLRRMGGSGTVNPNTGLREYKGLKGILGAILPIALNFFVPGLGAAIGGAMGATGMAASALGGAVIGGATSGLTGGNVLQGAVLGGLGGGAGGMAGKAISDATGMGLSAAQQGILGSGLAGGVTGAATGQGFLKGATQGALGQMAGNAISGMGGSGAMGTGLKAGGTQFGNMLAAGYDPKTAALSGGLSGIAAGMSAKPTNVEKTGLGLKPSDAVVQGLKMPESYSGVPEAGLSTANLSGMPKYTGGDSYNVNYGLTNPSSLVTQGMAVTDGGSGLTIPSSVSAPVGSVSTPGILSNLNLGNVGSLAMLASGLSSAPPAAQQAVQAMSPQQQEYFNRPSVVWDWDKMQQDASASGLDLGQYMSRNWDKVASGGYNSTAAPKFARGGALSAIANFANGAGSGRADTIDAKLSDGEYVMDAETVAMLGDGSSKEGAKRLDKMRENLRAHKGKMLSKGKISPNAKSPLSYLKGAA
jgi:hypothetical protein